MKRTIFLMDPVFSDHRHITGQCVDMHDLALDPRMASGDIEFNMARGAAGIVVEAFACNGTAGGGPMKKLINDPRASRAGDAGGARGSVSRARASCSQDVIVAPTLAAPAARRVAVLSGGGSGHEPAHAGYVGAGDVERGDRRRCVHVAHVDAVVAAIRAAAGPAARC